MSDALMPPYNDKSCVPIGVVLHNSNVLDKVAYLRSGTRVLKFERLAELRHAVRQFIDAIAVGNAYLDERSIVEQLAARQLTAKGFWDQWASSPRKSLGGRL